MSNVLTVSAKTLWFSVPSHLSNVPAVVGFIPENRPAIRANVLHLDQPGRFFICILEGSMSGTIVRADDVKTARQVMVDEIDWFGVDAFVEEVELFRVDV